MKHLHFLLIMVLLIIGLSLRTVNGATESIPTTTQSSTTNISSKVNPHAPANPNQTHRRVAANPVIPVTTAPPDISQSGFQIIEFLRKIFPGLPNL